MKSIQRIATDTLVIGAGQAGLAAGFHLKRAGVRGFLGMRYQHRVRSALLGGLAGSICVFATLVGLDRDRAFYATVLVVIASYYALFAVMGASTRALIIEPWFLVGALAAHGAFDLMHAQLIENPGVPGWWPQFCLAYDATASGYLAWLLWRRRPRDKLAT